MSLQLYIDDESTISNKMAKIKDVDAHFIFIKLDGCLFDRKAIEMIDKGAYRDSNTFIDRFGSKLNINQLSTGTKAALDVYHQPDKCFYMTECGENVKTFILENCKDGCIYVEDTDLTFGWAGEEKVDLDIELDGRKFHKLSDLNNYIQTERLFAMN